MDFSHKCLTVADLGGVRGVRPHPPWRPSEKIQGLLISKIADSTIIIITNFYLAAGSHEIFLRVGGREGMKGIGAFQRHQLPHTPCKNPASATDVLCRPSIKFLSLKGSQFSVLVEWRFYRRSNADRPS